MLEVLLVFFLGTKLGQKAQGRGLSKNYGWLIVPFWVLPEFFGALLLTLLEADMIGVYAGALVAAGIGAAVAFIVVGKMGSPVAAQVPSGYPAVVNPPVITPTMAPPAAPAIAPTAGFCSECGERVWLTPNGACSRGHGSECISGHYTPGK